MKYNDVYIYIAEFTVDETRNMIDTARKICGETCEITIDTVNEHYWNYKIDPKEFDDSWGDTIYTDYGDFNNKALKFCVEILEPNKALELAKMLNECDCVKFSDSAWYKFTQKSATKENAVRNLCAKCKISPANIIAFGDDLVDMGMLRFCGKGIAMGNAVDEVKNIADLVIGSNDDDGIADYLAESFMELL